MEVAKVHSWLMENLEPKDLITGKSIRPHVHPPLNAKEEFTFRRFGEFVHGVLEWGSRLYEFLPGHVRVHERLPEHLGGELHFNPHKLPSFNYVCYGHAQVNQHYYRQYVDYGWVKFSPDDEPGRGKLPSPPAINGLAITYLFSRYASLMRRAYKAMGESFQEGPRPAQQWTEYAALVTHTTERVELLRRYVYHIRAYDPIAPEIQELWDVMRDLEDNPRPPDEMKDHFQTALRKAMLGLLDAEDE